MAQITATDTNDHELIAQPQHSFLFFSALLHKPVYDASGTLIGQLRDVAISVAYMFPPVVAFVVQRGRWEPFALTGRWSDVADVDSAAIRLSVGIQALTPSTTDVSGEVLIRDALLDKQIVDMNGAKVVRVNDLHFLKLGACELRLVHVDVGTRGLVRRMGWEAARRWCPAAAATSRPLPRRRTLDSLAIRATAVARCEGAKYAAECRAARDQGAAPG